MFLCLPQPHFSQPRVLKTEEQVNNGSSLKVMAWVFVPNSPAADVPARCHPHHPFLFVCSKYVSVYSASASSVRQLELTIIRLDYQLMNTNRTLANIL